MKVLAVTPLYPPFSRVGAWMSTHECLRHLVTRGHEVHAATLLAGLGYDHDQVTVLGRWDRSVAGYDLVISHHGDIRSGVRDLCADEGVPHLLMVHGNPDKVDAGRHVVWNSETSRADRAGIVVRPHVDPDEYRTARGDRITLVNLSIEKGGNVFRRIARQMPDHQFLGVQGGYGRQLRLGGANTETVGTTQFMARDVYSRTRVLLMPSVAETWGRTGIEAMCSGIPVIAHPTPGLRESLGDAGIFVDRSDLAGWIAAIRDLDDPERYAAVSAAAFARAAEVCAQTAADLDLFAELVEGCA